MSTQPAKAAVVLIKNAAAAPFLYFDEAPVYGAINGMVEVELTARVNNLRSDNKIVADVAAIAHLRMSPHAANSLRNALDQALQLLNTPAEQKH